MLVNNLIASITVRNAWFLWDFRKLLQKTKAKTTSGSPYKKFNFLLCLNHIIFFHLICVSLSKATVTMYGKKSNVIAESIIMLGKLLKGHFVLYKFMF